MKNKVFSNLLWRFAERCGAQIVSLIVSIVLARLLLPEDYGTIALITVFITILQVFVDSGLGSALIQKKNADNVDFSTVFFFNVLVCIIIYILMFFSAPLIATFYNKPELVSLVRVISLIIVISGIKNVQQAYVSCTMQFKKFFFSTIGGTIASAFFGITLAYLGFGVWALVAQQLSNAAIDTLVLWLTVKWRPQLVFSFERLRGLFQFGWKLLVSSLLDTVYNNLRNLIIGKLYSTEDLAFYNKASQFPNLIVVNINTSIDSVLLPTLSKEQDDVGRVKAMTKRAIKISTYIMAPLMIGLLCCAEPFISLLLTDKWLPCVPYMRIFCITFLLYPIHTANLNAIKAMGRSDLFLRLEVIKKVIGVVLLIVSMRYGVMAMAYSLLIGGIVAQIINSWPNKKLLNYGYVEQIKDILPSLALSILMGLVVFGIGYINIPNLWVLIVQILVGCILYVIGSRILKLDSYLYLLDIIKPLFKKINHGGTRL